MLNLIKLPDIIIPTNNINVNKASNISFEEKNIGPRVKHIGGNIMICGCFAAFETGKILAA